jgi:hypothetical protein
MTSEEYQSWMSGDKDVLHDIRDQYSGKIAGIINRDAEDYIAICTGCKVITLRRRPVGTGRTKQIWCTHCGDRTHIFLPNRKGIIIMISEEKP